MSADISGSGPVFYIVAGEESGDRHAAELLRALREEIPDAQFKGVGGRHLRAAGQDQLFDLAQHAVVGLVDVLLNYSKFKKLFNMVKADIVKQKPAAVIFVDFPGFNLRLLKVLRASSVRSQMIYYISPQVWAWKQGRAKYMEKALDLLLVIFPFEKEWFEKRHPRLKVEWVGHPIIDRWDPAKLANKIEEKPVIEPGEERPFEEVPEGERRVIVGREEVGHRIALLPGSRQKEIEAHLPIFLETARKVTRAYPDTVFHLLTPDDEVGDQIRSFIREQGDEFLRIEIQSGYQLTHLSRCDLALVASGTATLECALAGLPMMVVYKVNPMTFTIGKMLVKLPYLSIVNLLANKKIVPEFLQKKAEPELLFQAIRRLFDTTEWRIQMQKDLAEATASLGKPGANKRAAQAIAKTLDDLK